MESETPKRSKIIVFGGGFIAICIGIAVLGAIFAPNLPSPPPIHAAVEIPAPSDATPDEEGEPRTDVERQQLFSDYVGSIAEKLNAMSLIGMTYAARLRQDAQYGDLPDQRKDAETMRELLQQQEKEVTSVPVPLNLSEHDFGRFYDVQQAAETIAMDSITIAVAVAVEANTGIDATEPGDPTDASIKRDKRAFKSAVISGYKYFGVQKNRINLETLTLKN